MKTATSDRLLTRSEVARALGRCGLEAVREGKKNTLFWREGLPRPIPLPRRRGYLRRRLVEKIIEQAHLTDDEFREALKK